MRGLVLAGAAGALVALAVLLSARPLADHPALGRENHRGRRLPTASGAVLVLTLLCVAAGRALVDAERAPAVVAAVVGFAFLGLLDDLLGDGDRRGLAGHVGALVHGSLTTGAVKLVGGIALALAVTATDPVGRHLVDAAVVAGAANLGNLFDRAPGRTLKVALLAWCAVAAVAGAGAVGQELAVLAAAAAVLVVPDLRERAMLGDTGANALGAGLGMAVVLTLGPGARQLVAAAVLALTLLSERVSFSRVIEAVPPLHAFDRLGRLP